MLLIVGLSGLFVVRLITSSDPFALTADAAARAGDLKAVADATTKQQET